MKLTTLMSVLLSVFIGFSALESLAVSKTTSKNTTQKSVVQAVKKQKKTVTHKKTKTTVKTVKSKTKSAKKAKNESKSLYGVKGAKLQPTKVQAKRYTYSEKGKTHTTISKEASRQYGQSGVASYYGAKFNGSKTASGEVYNQNAYTAAHKTLAFGSYALVTNLRNGRKVIARINDRGPFSQSRIIDLSLAAAREIGMVYSGIAKVRVEAIQVDKEGYIVGKGVESLRRLAKKEGLPLTVKGKGDQVAIKANPQGKTASQAVKKSKKTEKTIAEKVPTLSVTVKTEQEAKKVVRTVKQKASIRKKGQMYDVLIAVADQKESERVKKQLTKMINYQKIHYSIK